MRSLGLVGAAGGMLVLLLAFPRPMGEATAAASPSLSISPAIVDTVASPGATLEPINVSNGTGVPFNIRVYPALVDQRLDGGLVIREHRRDRARASRMFSLRPRSLLLKPGKSASLTERFLRAAAGQPAAYGAAVVEAVPVNAGKRPPGYRLKILGALLIRTPDARRARGRVVAVTVTRVGPRRLRFALRVANRSQVHGYAEHLRLRLRDAAGRTLLVGAPRGGVVLPGFRRDCPLDLFRRLRPGRYTAEATGQFAATRSRVILHFTIAAANRVSTQTY